MYSQYEHIYVYTHSDKSLFFTDKYHISFFPCGYKNYQKHDWWNSAPTTKPKFLHQIFRLWKHTLITSNRDEIHKLVNIHNKTTKCSASLSVFTQVIGRNTWNVEMGMWGNQNSEQCLIWWGKKTHRATNRIGRSQLIVYILVQDYESICWQKNPYILELVTPQHKRWNILSVEMNYHTMVQLVEEYENKEEVFGGGGNTVTSQN